MHASLLGMERLVMKKGSHEGVFPGGFLESVFQVGYFSGILAWGAANGSICRFEEKTLKNGRIALVMRISGVDRLSRAQEVIKSVSAQLVQEKESDAEK